MMKVVLLFLLLSSAAAFLAPSAPRPSTAMNLRKVTVKFRIYPDGRIEERVEGASLSMKDDSN